MLALLKEVVKDALGGGVGARHTVEELVVVRFLDKRDGGAGQRVEGGDGALLKGFLLDHALALIIIVVVCIE